MNTQLIDQARAAYRAGDFSAAAQMFAAAKDTSEIAGEVDHLRGNALMRLGLWNDAVQAYSLALPGCLVWQAWRALHQYGQGVCRGG